LFPEMIKGGQKNGLRAGPLSAVLGQKLEQQGIGENECKGIRKAKPLSICKLKSFRLSRQLKAFGWEGQRRKDKRLHKGRERIRRAHIGGSVKLGKLLIRREETSAARSHTTAGGKGLDTPKGLNHSQSYTKLTQTSEGVGFARKRQIVNCLQKRRRYTPC